MKSSHTKGHQNSSGKIILAGTYEPESPSVSTETWQNWIRDSLTELYNHPTRMADELHRERLGHFYSILRSKTATATSITSLTTCLNCLMEVPQHPLQCGHTLCTPCVKAYGRHPIDPNSNDPNSSDPNSFVMDYCPLHDSTFNKQSWTVRFKPEYAGVRCLTLDG